MFASPCLLVVYVVFQKILFIKKICVLVSLPCVCMCVGQSALCVHVCWSVCLVCACVLVDLPCVCICVGRSVLCVSRSALCVSRSALCVHVCWSVCLVCMCVGRSALCAVHVSLNREMIKCVPTFEWSHILNMYILSNKINIYFM